MNQTTQRQCKVKYSIYIPVNIDYKLAELALKQNISMGEVIKRSITLYNYVTENADNDKKLLLFDEGNGDVAEIVFNKEK